MKVLGGIPRFIRSERNRQGRTQEDVAEAAKLSKTQISKIETEVQSPNLETLDKVLVGLGLSFAEFSQRYLDMEDNERAKDPDSEPGTTPAMSPELYTLTKHIARGCFETDEHYVIVIPKKRETR